MVVVLARCHICTLDPLVRVVKSLLMFDIFYVREGGHGANDLMQRSWHVLEAVKAIKCYLIYKCKRNWAVDLLLSISTP